MRDTIKLIYFKDCPNYEAARILLLNSGCDFEEVDQNSLAENHPFKHYTSPAILKNGKLIIGERTDSGLGGCSIQFPDDAELKRILEI